MQGERSGPTLRRTLRRILAAPFVLVAAVVILIEDWLWDDLARVAAAIGRLPVFSALEALIGRLPPYGALSLFALPTLLLVPVKLLAVWVLAQGHTWLGLGIAGAAKLAGTALVARIYALTEARLLTIAWFASLHRRVVDFRAAVYGFLDSNPAYRLARRLVGRFKDWRLRVLSRRSLLPVRWSAALRLRRQRRS